MQLSNNKGEGLYLLTIVESKDFCSPHVRINTWDKVVKSFEELIKEVDDDHYLIKQVKVTRLPEYNRMEAILLCNHKGWGGDYFKSITIEAAYLF